MEYKSFREFYWKSAIFKIGLPACFIAGLIFVIIQDKEILHYFLSFEVIIQVLIFVVIGSPLVALTAGRSLWKISQRATKDNKAETKDT